MATNSLKWDPNNFMPTLLHSEKPLLDNTNTPRAAKRAITLERSFDKFAWMYNRNTLENFNNGFQITKDKNKSKILKKQIRNKKKSMAATSASKLGMTANSN